MDKDTRPLTPIGHRILPAKVTRESLAELRDGPTYRDLVAYFNQWPARSLMAPDSRAVLFSLIRMMCPKVVAEVGTLFAGTTEVMARALWENVGGVIHTTDPAGGGRCPPIIAAWPPELRDRTFFHALNSMEFFAELGRRRIVLDLVLVDGNHDYEFALFDLQMAARLLRPGGVIVMDNAEQTGPFQAARRFLSGNSAWRELGDAVASYDRSQPFDETRASLSRTSFVVLQAPPCLSIGEGPHSWGQLPADSPFVGGLVFELPAQHVAGNLHYRVYTRAFADGDRWVGELQTKGSLRIEVAGEPRTLSHIFPEPLTFDVPARYTEATFSAEIDLSWLADAGLPPLALSRIPMRLGRPK
jgi:predicted O-methyltransferase YrrM